MLDTTNSTLLTEQQTCDALSVLLNNQDEVLSPPLPIMQFRYNKQDGGYVYEGAVSASQYDRLQHLVHEAGMRLDIGVARDHPGQGAIRIELYDIVPERLFQLAEQEPQRRMRSKSAEGILSRMTGLSWGWDGMTLCTPVPSERNPAHSLLDQFRDKGVIKQPHDMSVSRNDNEQGEAYWLTVHDLDVARLRLMQNQIAPPSIPFSR